MGIISTTRPIKALRSKLLTVFFVFALLLSSVPSFAGKGDAIALPDLTTDEQKLAYLLAVKKQVPKLFEDAATYDIDLFDVLGDQAKLVTTLKDNPQYRELFEAKHYHELTLTPPKEGLIVGSKQIKPEAVQAWKDELTGILEEYSKTLPSGSFEKALRADGGVQDFKKLGTDINKAVMGVVTRSRRKDELLALYNKKNSAPLEEKLSSFGLEIEKIADLTEEEKGLKDIIERGIKDLQAQRKKQALAHLWIVMNRTKPAPTTFAEVADRIESLTDQDLIYLTDKEDALGPIVKGLFSSESEAAVVLAFAT